MKRPFVSIVVCIYNGERDLQDCIEALVSQSYPADRYEIVLIDDGSRDTSAEICKEWIRRQAGIKPAITYVYQENQGLAHARNAGAAVSRGEIVAFIDQDALAEQDWLKSMVEAFASPDIGVVGGKIIPFSNSGFTARFLYWIHYFNTGDGVNERIEVIGANMAFRKEVLERVGGFCPAFRSYGDETNVIERIRRESQYRVGTTPYAVVEHRQPEQWGKWIRERFRNGRAHALRRIVRLRDTGRALPFCGYVLLRLATASLPLWLGLALLGGGNAAWSVPIIVAGVFVYRAFGRTKIWNRAKILVKQYGMARAVVLCVFGTILVGAGFLVCDLGFVMGLFHYRMALFQP